MIRMSLAALIAAEPVVPAHPALSQVWPGDPGTQSINCENDGPKACSLPKLLVNLLGPDRTVTSPMVRFGIIDTPVNACPSHHARDLGLMRPTSGCGAHEDSAATSTFTMEG